MTLEEAKVWLRQRVSKGAECPCCKQFAKIYTRSLNSSMAVSLILFYKHTEPNGLHKHVDDLMKENPKFTEILAKSREFHKLVHWGLLDVETKTDDEGTEIGRAHV